MSNSYVSPYGVTLGPLRIQGSGPTFIYKETTNSKGNEPFQQHTLRIIRVPFDTDQLDNWTGLLGEGAEANEDHFSIEIPTPSTEIYTDSEGKTHSVLSQNTVPTIGWVVAYTAGAMSAIDPTEYLTKQIFEPYKLQINNNTNNITINTSAIAAIKSTLNDIKDLSYFEDDLWILDGGDPDGNARQF